MRYKKHREIIWPETGSTLTEPIVKSKKEIIRELTVGTAIIAIGATALAAVMTGDPEAPPESSGNNGHEWSLPLVD